MRCFIWLSFALGNIFIKLVYNKPIFDNNSVIKFENRKPKFKIKDQSFVTLFSEEMNHSIYLNSDKNDNKRSEHKETLDNSTEKALKTSGDLRGQLLIDFSRSGEIDTKVILITDVDKNHFIVSKKAVSSKPIENINKKKGNWQLHQEYPPKEKHDAISNKMTIRENYNKCTDFEHGCSGNYSETMNNLSFVFPNEGFINLSESSPNAAERPLNLSNKEEIDFHSPHEFGLNFTNDMKPDNSESVRFPEKSKLNNTSSNSNNKLHDEDSLLVVRIGSGTRGFERPTNSKVSNPSYLECPEKCFVRDLNGDCLPDLECWNNLIG